MNSDWLRTAISSVFNAGNTQNRRNPSIKATMSSIAIILYLPQLHQSKLKQVLSIEILLLQRAINEKDFYSGNICLPGGKVEEGQTQLEAAIRQTKEQIGILQIKAGMQLKKQDLVCVVDQMILARQISPTHHLYTQIFIFLVNKKQKLTLNLDQIQKYQWLPISHFLKEDIYVYQPIQSSQVLNSFLKAMKKKGKKIAFPAIEVGMGMALYGVTFYVFGMVAHRMAAKLEEEINKIENNIIKQVQESTKNTNLRDNLAEYRRIIYFMNKFYNHFYAPLKIQATQQTPQLQKEAEALNQYYVNTYFKIRPRL